LSSAQFSSDFTQINIIKKSDSDSHLRLTFLAPLTYPLIIEELRPGESSPGRFSFETMVARWAPRQLARKRVAIVFTNFVLRPSNAAISRPSSTKSAEIRLN
jgi:hypothetical protein